LQLAKTLVQPFDLLLLDEPTNHLDIGMIYWLENYLSSLTKPYILISHDRYFLDKTVNRIFEIKKKNLQIYKGNFMSYQTESKRLDELAEKQFDQQQKKIKKEEEFIRKNMAGQKVNQAKSRQKQLEKMDIIEKPTSRRKVNLNFAIKKRSGERVYQFKNASFGFDEPLFEDFNEMIKFQDKIAILGKNGCGKSTLLKIINDEYKLNRGEIIHGSSISLGYYDQFHIELDEDLTVKETLLQLRPNMTDGEVYSYLAKYEFYEKDWDKKVQFISGGERSRLYLSKLIFQKPNVLILDEPTNHLDILMIDSLESALKNYEGTIIFVSHDRLFIENVANRLFLFDNKKITEVFRSLKQIFDENLRHDTKEKKVRKQSINKKNSKKTNPFLITKLENKIEVLEDDISKIKNEIDQLELQFSNPKNLANPQFMKELNGNIKLKKNNLKKIIGELDNAEIDYLEMIEE
ncbi:MAG: ABC-F family ATP-binding cassette domain-containing protein, partial [Candidatus Cloacimonadota bacterium]|nr:ABC-F family ATP-binding cassette domain-containing protein [Candidatus Cloacimonadota bacterium]